MRHKAKSCEKKEKNILTFSASEGIFAWLTMIILFLNYKESSWQINKGWASVTYFFYNDKHFFPWKYRHHDKKFPLSVHFCALFKKRYSPFCSKCNFTVRGFQIALTKAWLKTSLQGFLFTKEGSWIRKCFDNQPFRDTESDIQ